MQRVLAAAGPARSYSKRILKRMAGHPRTWAPKEVAPVPPPAYPVVPVETLPSGWAPPAVTSSTQGAMSVASTLPFQVSLGVATRAHDGVIMVFAGCRKWTQC